MWFRSKRRSADADYDTSKIRTRCPDCKREVVLFCEQTDLFASGHSVWVFCSICTRLVSPERFVPAN
jgi:hypothetical protein